ncbi:hypothetical protein SAMN04487886_10875 [Clostridium sp. DSM 8431]|uniref:HNH endonuclease signature motif containing protein n=1 Tax=Clostridium sp. DSM 8431 TaxID=1761781 RepID=UPI0008F43FD2|nr:HNH endonuclease signature motif containing protein [Clostridium sp. DSM 8431]SFU64998.1 hypothetical protein SAMN04487886_10875 [Clostridium sp. DSM 8431]
MYFCEICNEKADVHHIIHRSEGGFDIEINYKYLCPKHHRGKNGPHRCLETDIKYKIELQDKLYNILSKEYYTSKELGSILNIPSNTLKRITKKIKLYKEGYKRDDIILTLMGNKLYSEETLEDLEIKHLLDNIL